MAEARESLTAWLRDAHAMEGQAITLLETQIDRLQSYPEAIPRLAMMIGAHIVWGAALGLAANALLQGERSPHGNHTRLVPNGAAE